MQDHGMKRTKRSNVSMVGFQLAMGASPNDLTLDSTRTSVAATTEACVAVQATTAACEVAVSTEEEATTRGGQCVQVTTPE
jgi:uncharacterized protein (DUF1499 family)